MPYHQLRMKYIISQNIIIFIKNWYCKSGIIPIPAIFCIFIMFLILFNFVPIYISFSFKTDVIHNNNLQQVTRVFCAMKVDCSSVILRNSYFPYSNGLDEHSCHCS